jgi:hypothetical protein
MELLERIEEQIQSTQLPLFAITVAAVPCPDTPVILTLHWHAFVRERLIESEHAEPVAFRPVPSSALQLNQRWDDLLELDRAALDAGWELGAWDVARAERPACTRPGADSAEALDCLKAFGAFPPGATDPVVVSDAPDADELLSVAARRGYLMWTFRPVRGGIWMEFADDATLRPDGTREPPCPVLPIPPTAARARRTVYRFGKSERIIH